MFNFSEQWIMKYFAKVYFLLYKHIYFDFNKFTKLIVLYNETGGHIRDPKVATWLVLGNQCLRYVH